MSDERQSDATNVRKESVSEELDAINEELRQKDAQAAQQQLEAALEKETENRRKEEKPVSGGFKNT